MSRAKNWNLSVEQISFISKNKLLPRKELVELFNNKFHYSLTTTQINGICRRLKLFTGRNGYFKKGTVPPNAGTKGWMKVNSGSFKKGRLSHNSVQIGGEITTQRGYVRVKVAEPNVWKSKHILIWEQANKKKTPTGHIVIFLDSNKQNLAPDNLACIKRSVGVRLNSNNYTNTPPPLKPIVMNMSKIQAKIGDLVKK